MKTQSPELKRFKETTESQLREQIRDLCKITGWKMYFTFNSMHSPKGMTDLILCRPPRVIFAELKREGQDLKPDQEQWRDLLLECPGVEWYIWRPSDIERITNVLRGIG
jgi:hypothetical protein